MAVLLVVAGCTPKQQNIRDRFTGRWVASYFIDSLSLGNIGTVGFGSTEISIPHACDKEGITSWNEDVEGNWVSPTVWHDDTLAVMYGDEIVNRMTIQDDRLVSVFYGHTLVYWKADSSIIHKADSLGITVVRLLINRVLSRQVFTNEETRATVQFEENGRVSGLENFVRYNIAIAGDEANIEKCTSISFFDIDGKITKWGMKGFPQKVELYTLRLLTEPGEKPWYEAEQLVCTLLVNSGR